MHNVIGRTALLLAAIGSPAPFASCQSTPASAIPLTPYTTPDQSASVGVPPGWKVTSGRQTVIQMAGPQGETVALGNTIVAHNAAFQAGQRPGKGIDLNMPYSASLAQKLTMLTQQGAALSGKQISQFTVTSSTPLQLPASMGQCGRFVASYGSQQGPTKQMAVFCSLPPDTGGNYKNILLAATAPAAVATQSAPMAQAIFRSYTMPKAWLQKKLAPVGVAPAMGVNPAAAAAAMNHSTILGAAGSNVSVNCFSLGVLRETPNYDLPKGCGGTKPD